MSSSQYEDSEGERPLSLEKPSVPAKDADDSDSDKPQLLSPDQPAEPAEGTDHSDSDEHQLSSPDKPSSPAEDADHSDSDKPKPTTRGVKEIIREKLKALGRPLPPSPPPPPNPSKNRLSQELLDLGGQVIYKKFSCWIVKHACGTKLTKFRRGGVRPSEAEAMRFVSEHTSIPVPRVYDVGEEHITMEFIEGDTLAKAWEDILSVEDRTLVARQLRDYINQLRAIKSPDGMICSFGRRPAVDSRLFYHEAMQLSMI
ncbi:hypothetical protein VTI28DRAFT_9038 [Corynascus sepedonium]